MAHHHPASYETEGRIRQQEKLERARLRRQAQVARAGRERSRPGLVLLSHLRDAAATAARTLRPLAPERG